MRKLLLFAFSFLFIFLTSVTAVSAASKDLPKNVEVKADEHIEHDYFVSGDNVTISGTIDGDAYIFAQKILINGEIKGDLIAAGGNISIPGKVSQDARLAGGKINIAGNVDGSATIGSGDFSLDRSGSIGKSAVIGAGTIVVDGRIGKDATLGGGEVTINNSIGGSLMAGITHLTLRPGARIAGDINYWSEDNLTVDEGSSVSGSTNKHEVKNAADSRQRLNDSINGVRFALKVVGFLYILILGLIFVKMLPVYTKQAANLINTMPLKSFGFGLLFSILAPILILLLLITIIGIPIALLLLFCLFLFFVFAKIIVAYFLGVWLEKRLKMSNSQALTFTGGLIVFTLISLIPVFGGIFSFILQIAGVGSLVTAHFGLYKNLRSKDLI